MTPPFVIVIGDQVQARIADEQGVVAVSEFTVTGITDGVISGAPLLGDLNPADGWTFELTRKGDPGLPDTLSDLAVWTVQERTEPTRIVGPLSGDWQTAAGVSVNPADVLAWVPWTDLPTE